MKKQLYTIALLGMSAIAQAQPEVTTTEYFFDKDPGYGKGKVAGTSDNGRQDFNADISDLKQGFHTLNVRGRNIYGWGQTVSFQFVLFDKANEIVGTEYYFNEDPGSGKGVFTPISGKDTLSSFKTNVANINYSTNNLDPGYHHISVRALNGDKTWTESITTPFVYLKSPEVPKKAEYYFDHDPGEGNGKVIKVDGTTLAFPFETSNLSNGNHVLYVRTQDGAGKWNIEEVSPFTLQKKDEVAKADWNIPVYVSPNPAQYSFTIQFGKHISENDSVTVSIYSQSGKELSKKNYPVINNVITLSTAAYSSGSYLVQISKDWLSTSKRLIIKKRQSDDNEE